MKFQLNIRFLFLLVLITGAFLSGWLLSSNALIRSEGLPGVRQVTAVVGISAHLKRGKGKEAVLVSPLGSRDGLKIDDLGLVTRRGEIVAVVAIISQQDDVSVSKVVKQVKPELTIGFGDRVEFTIVAVSYTHLTLPTKA